MSRLSWKTVKRSAGRDEASSAVDPPIVSFVGRSNVGKTTLLGQIISELRAHQINVGVMKHHHHTTSFDTPGKDTFRLSEAGANLVVGVSPVQVATFRNIDDPNIDSILRSSFVGMDIVLTEGHKRGPYPKIEVVRASRSTKLLCSEDELLAVVTDLDLSIGARQFRLDDASGVAAYLVGCLPRRSPLP
jgi:molybdopterin-guanine dinucleotide biosynthesis protein MobB